MLPSITKRYTDHSTEDDFSFVFFCDCCDGRWASERYPFSMRDSPPGSEGEQQARVILWKAEHDAAYERANREAMLHFNKCPICGRRVCDGCFCEFEVSCLQCQTSKKQPIVRRNHNEKAHS